MFFTSESATKVLGHRVLQGHQATAVHQVEQTRQGSHQKKQKLARARSASLGRSKNAAGTCSALVTTQVTTQVAAQVTAQLTKSEKKTLQQLLK